MEEYELEHTGCARQEAVLVRGGNRLCGELTVQGAKNSTLPLLAAALLCEGETVLHNCPALSDVHTAVTILRRLGCRCTHTGDTLTVCADGMTRCDIPHSLMREMRSSIVFLGAILSRCGEARLSFPGGCEAHRSAFGGAAQARRRNSRRARLPVVHCARRVARWVRLACVPKRRRNGKPAARRRPRQGHNSAHKRRA